MSDESVVQGVVVDDKSKAVVCGLCWGAGNEDRFGSSVFVNRGDDAAEWRVRVVDFDAGFCGKDDGFKVPGFDWRWVFERDDEDLFGCGSGDLVGFFGLGSECV